ncbi:carbon-nitrogen hydrolase family protein [Massilia sp. HP4]|uniref:carbon-nitrogen hydrolase family protein n=1 Tax=Massilia sp. HP4 TaxID=2562316 RepID=UPI0010C02264|nr:carbon-nitrogen hydrolase family protein [Massilia sp. HP4]
MKRTFSQYKVAAVQAAPEFLDLDAGIEKAEMLIAKAAEQGCKLIGFPETWLPGYPWWLWLGSPAWGMRFLKKYVDNSLQIRSPQFERLKNAARKNNIVVVMGYSEMGATGSLYIAQCTINSDGRLVHSRRKLKPTHVERTLFGEGQGSDLAVNELEIGNVGALCCWEHLQPLNRYAMYAQNEQVHVSSWPSFCLYEQMAYALGPVVNLGQSRSYAVEGQCYVIASVATVSSAMVDLLCDTPERQELLKVGGGYAAIFGPDGRQLTEHIEPTEEGLVVADIDLEAITYSKAVADPAGHYARPDATRMIVNRKGLHPVEFLDGDADGEANEVERAASPFPDKPM